jgi:hypothetical protein
MALKYDERYNEAWLIEQLVKPGYGLAAGSPAQPLPVYVPEKSLQEEVRLLCHHLGYLYYHTLKSKGSTAGLPDCLIVPPGSTTLYAWELKRTGAQPSPAQRRWLEALAQVRSVHTGTFVPADWPQIVELLTRKPTA